MKESNEERLIEELGLIRGELECVVLELCELRKTMKAIERTL